jgi:hypothetical protein
MSTELPTNFPDLNLLNYHVLNQLKQGMKARDNRFSFLDSLQQGSGNVWPLVYHNISNQPSTNGYNGFTLKSKKIGVQFSTDYDGRKRLNNNNVLLSETIHFKENNNKRLKITVC